MANGPAAVDTERARRHADAVYADARSTHEGRATLRRHHRSVLGKPAWRFPYADRVYVAHRFYATPITATNLDHAGVWKVTLAPGWSVSLWLAPFSDESLDLPRDPVIAPGVYLEPLGPLVHQVPTLRDAVRGLALKLIGTPCDHGCTRGVDTCTGCDMLDDLYDNLP